MANKNYLDKSGLQFFWGKIKDWIAGKHYLSYDSQGLTSSEKTQARENLGVVSYEEQTLTDAQKTQARTNIGAIASAALPEAATASPLMDATTAAVGTSTKYAREDHKHPIDTSRAPIASPTFTGTPKAPTAAAGTSTSQLATTAFVQTAVGSASSALDTRLSALEAKESIWDGKQDALTFDSTPSSGSSNPVTSSGIASALNALSNNIILEALPTKIGYEDIATYCYIHIDGNTATFSASEGVGTLLDGAWTYQEKVVFMDDNTGAIFYLSHYDVLNATDYVLYSYYNSILTLISVTVNNPQATTATGTVSTVDLNDLATADSIANAYVKYATAQSLTTTQQSQARSNIGAGTYSKPADGIPKSDLSTSLQSAIDNANSALQSLPIATTSELGGVIVGTNISVDNFGTISVATASGTNLGLAKQGTNITVNSDGSINANEASSSAKGVVQLSTDIEADSSSNTKAVTPNAVVNYVSTQVGTAFSYGGSIAFANLPATPTSSDVNKIYNITDSFTTTSAFVEGAGKTYPAGTNIIVANVSGTPKYDVTTGFLDLSPYATSSWVTDNFVANTTLSDLVYSSELIAITDAEITAIVV